MYRGINAWLEKEIAWWKMPYYVILAALLIWSCDHLIVFFVLNPLGIEVAGPRIEHVQHGLETSKHTTDYSTLIQQIPTYLKEEFDFRAPLFLVAFIPQLVIPAVLLFSALFGWLHGDLSNLAIQGVSGIIFSVMFLKFGGMQRSILKGLKGLLASTSTHTLFMLGLWVSTKL